MAKPTLADMLECVSEEIVRIRGTQRALVEAGMRAEPDVGQIRKADAFEALTWIVETIMQDEAGFRRWAGTTRSKR